MKATTKEPPKYVGPREVQSVEDTSDEHFVMVRFTDGTWEEYNRQILNAVLTEEPSGDLTDLRDRTLKPVVQKVLEVMAWNNLKLEDLDYFTSQLIGSIQHNLDRAEGKAWRRDGEESRDIHARSLRDIDRILKG